VSPFSPNVINREGLLSRLRVFTKLALTQQSCYQVQSTSATRPVLISQDGLKDEIRKAKTTDPDDWQPRKMG